MCFIVFNYCFCNPSRIYTQTSRNCCPWGSDHSPNARPNHTRKPLDCQWGRPIETMVFNIRICQNDPKWSKMIRFWMIWGSTIESPKSVQSLSSSRALISRKIHDFRLLKNFSVRPLAATALWFTMMSQGNRRFEDPILENHGKIRENPAVYVLFHNVAAKHLAECHSSAAP